MNEPLKSLFPSGGESDLTEDELSRIEENEDAFLVTLSEPLTYVVSKLDGERTIEKLPLRKKIKGKHLKAMDKAEGEMAKSMALLAAISGTPQHAVEEMDGRDVVLCLEVCRPSLPRGRGDGK